MSAPDRIVTNKSGTMIITPPAIPLHETDIEWVRAARIAELEAENARLKHALVVWDAAHRTGRNEPLVVAFETGAAALRALEQGKA